MTNFLICSIGILLKFLVILDHGEWRSSIFLITSIYASYDMIILRKRKRYAMHSNHHRHFRYIFPAESCLPSQLSIDWWFVSYQVNSCWQLTIETVSQRSPSYFSHWIPIDLFGALKFRCVFVVARPSSYLSHQIPIYLFGVVEFRCVFIMVLKSWAVLGEMVEMYYFKKLSKLDTTRHQSSKSQAML